MSDMINKITTRPRIQGEIRTTKAYPDLEPLVAKPSLEEQYFKSKEYGYSTVTVNAIETENLDITPTLNEQNYEGVYNKVSVSPIKENNIVIDPKNEQQSFRGVYTDITVNEIQGDTLEITPTLEEQNFEGIYEKVTVKKIVGEEASIMPATETQTKQGIFTSVTMPGEENYKEENIRAGTSMWGLVGTMEGKGAENAVIDTNGTSNWFLREIGTIDCKGSTSLSSMFSSNSNLVKVDNLTNTHKCTETSYMFADCYMLEKAPVMDTSSLQKMSGMFRTCTQLRDVPEYNAEKVINVYSMFQSCSSLENFGGLLNLGKAYGVNTTVGYYNYELNLNACTLLTHESLMNVINKLYDLNEAYKTVGLRSQNLVLGETNLAKLTAEEIAIATDKGWTVS